ncbi:hypothetical protein EB796_021416 [Bugula neritina]|uniref:Uncharacterized protein n=1 Tax=Bugula neritina TaxID=10212 RepID=A0A7J7J2H0_BUGNE|nr:hypothetical protein EB796_021416 [Bugula neritina]
MLARKKRSPMLPPNSGPKALLIISNENLTNTNNYNKCIYQILTLTTASSSTTSSSTISITPTTSVYEYLPLRLTFVFLAIFKLVFKQNEMNIKY